MVKWKLKCIIVTFIIVAEITDGVILSLFVLNMSNSLLQKKNNFCGKNMPKHT